MSAWAHLVIVIVNIFFCIVLLIRLFRMIFLQRELKRLYMVVKIQDKEIFDQLIQMKYMSVPGKILNKSTNR